MKHIYKNQLNDRGRITHFLIPQTFKERTTGIKAFMWMPTDTYLLFKTPCVLHTFGIEKTILMTPFSNYLDKKGESVRVEPNTIVFCTGKATWIGESTAISQSHQNDKTLSSIGLKNRPESRIFASIQFLRLALVFFSLLIPNIDNVLAAQSSVTMQVGTSKEVILQQAPRNLNISNPDVLDVQRIGLSNKILVTALSAGESVLVAQYPNNTEKRWNFAVGSVSRSELSRDRLSSASLVRTAKELQKRTGLEVTIDSGTIAIFGQMSNTTQTKALIEICLGLTECHPRFTPSETALAHIIESMTQHLLQLSFTAVQLIPSFGGVIIKGTVANEADRRGITNLMRSVVPKTFDQLIVERANQTLIETELSFFRVSETGLTAMGVSSTTEFPTQSEGVLAAIASPIKSAKLKGGPLLNFSFPSVMLKALSKKGVIKQIAQPTLIIASGGRGEITSGGEFLFQSGGQVQKFLTQNYGISVALQPKVIGKEKIAQRIDLKITHPQSDPTHNSVSALTSSALTTEVSSAPNEELLLTRISQKASGKSISKIPILGHIPLFGELFKTRELSDEDAELWITLKSKIVESTLQQVAPVSERGDIDPHFSLLD